MKKQNLLNNSFNGDYKDEGVLTKNGYATFDLSSIPSGLYEVTGGAGISFIIIK